MPADKPTRYRLKDKEKKHVKPKPPRAGGATGRTAAPRWSEGDDRPPPRKRFDSDDRPPPRGPRKEYGDSPRGPKREFDGPKREWSDRPPSRGPRRDSGEAPRGRSFGGPKREWSDRPPRREFSDRAPRAGGGNADVLEALGKIEAAIKELTKRLTLIENQLDEVFGEE